jgi:glutamyl-Q tRNA(Asp) synthetase
LSPSGNVSKNGRFAPSPTGHLHLGSLYTAVASFVHAHSKQGQWFVRIDDLDTPRNVAGSAESILSDLESFHLYWDGSIVYQSHQLDFYQQQLDKLIRKGFCYSCICSRKTLSALSDDDVYPGVCRDKPISTSIPYAARIKTDDRIINFEDGLQGTIKQSLSRHGDFILKRKEGIFAYQFAVVVDDYRQKINEVVRGYDLLELTPRQIYLQQLLGFPQPEYYHLPVLVDNSGFKLSKQTNATKVDLARPEKTILQILNLLKQNPPPELHYASLDELLDWAVLNWNLEPIKKIATIKLTE